MEIKDLAQKFVDLYGGFAKNSALILKYENEQDGYRVTENMEDGKSGIMVFFSNKLYEEGIVFNNGWKMNKGYLGDACDFIIQFMNENKVPLKIDAITLITNSKSYKVNKVNENGL